MAWHPVRCIPGEISRRCQVVRYEFIIGPLPIETFQHNAPYLLGLAEANIMRLPRATRDRTQLRAKAQELPTTNMMRSRPIARRRWLGPEMSAIRCNSATVTDTSSGALRGSSWTIGAITAPSSC